MNVLMVICSGGWMPVHLSEGWRRLGWSVEEFFYGSHMGKTWSPEGMTQNHGVNRDLLAKAKQLKADGRLDLIFAVIYDDVLEPETARALKTLGVPMVNYHVDLVGQWQRVLRIGRYFDRVACAQRDHWDALRRAGIRPYYMPMAANPEKETPAKPPASFDGVLYLGSPWEYRTQVLSAVAKAGLPLRIYGNGWRAAAQQKFNFQPWQKALHDLRYYAFPFFREEGIGPVLEALARRLRRRIANEVPAHEIPADCIRGSYGDDDFAPLVSGAAVNLGFTHFKGAPGSPVEERQVRLRDFEIPMAGGFYLAQDCAQLRELFEPDRHLAVWNTLADLPEKIRFYLARPEERRRLAEAGKVHCEKAHSWESRFRGLLSELGISQAVIPAKAGTQNRGLGPDFRRGDELSLRSECPACGRPSGDSRPMFKTRLLGRDCTVQRCPCGLVYKGLSPGAGDIRSIYSEGYVHFQDPAAAEGPAETNSARQKLARCLRLLKGNPPAGGWKLLDVGCGKGQFVSIARKLGYAAEGIDTYLPEALATNGLHRGSLEDLEPASWDIVTLLNVAEHLVDPRPLFKSIKRVLRPEGVLLLTCPYGASLACRVHRERWVHMALDEHLLFWTPQSLTGFLRPLGFTGPVSYRIAGSPFPYGRISRPVGPQEDSRKAVEESNPAWQARLWKLARWIQTQERTANWVRAAVDWTNTGDYLEYAIQQNRAG